MKYLYNKFLKYFVRGLLFITPLGVTVLLVNSLLSWINDKLEATHLHGLVLFLFLSFVIAVISAIGYFGSHLVGRPIADLIDNFIKKIPGINVIYSSLKDVVGAFMGDNNKFNTPVLFKLTEDEGVWQMGFLTQEEMSSLELPDMCTVYVPHGYSFSGMVFLVKKEWIKPLDASGSEVMKFMVSGGVGGVHLRDKTTKGETS